MMRFFATQAFLIIYIASFSQSGYIWPVKGEIRLSGNFCELRPNHFHSGIDIKTGGKEGVPVHAADDGYVFRVKISATGYGKAVYIKHQHNRMTVYAHLSSLTGPVAVEAAKLQYEKQSYEIEFFPDSFSLAVKKGELIGYSGNSGSSEAPHLHFELRDHVTEEPLNPLRNGFLTEDTVKPEISDLVLYSYNSGFYQPVLQRKLTPDKYIDVLTAPADTIALAFRFHDRMNDSNASGLGIYKALMICQSDTVYANAFDRMNFDYTQTINSHIDQLIKWSNGEYYSRMHTVPGNNNPHLQHAGKGLIPVKDSMMIRILVYDANDNVTEKRFVVLKGGTMSTITQSAFEYPAPNYIYSRNRAELSLPDTAYYKSEDNISFSLEKAKNKLKYVKMSPEGLVLKKPANISFRIPKKWKRMDDKLLIAVNDVNGKFVRPVGGKVSGKYINATIRNFANYSLFLDTVPPVITFKGKVHHKDLDKDFFTLTISDELSGIHTYKCHVNGKWHLFEYDAKTSTLSAEVAGLPAEFLLEVTASDKNQNSFSIREKIKL